jgi:hypothetical protein
MAFLQWKRLLKSNLTVELYIESDNSSGDCYRIAIDFPSEDAENCILWRMFQHVPGSLLAQSQQTNSSRPCQQSEYYTQSNAFQSKQELNNWKVLAEKHMKFHIYLLKEERIMFYYKLHYTWFLKVNLSEFNFRLVW